MATRLHYNIVKPTNKGTTTTLFANNNNNSTIVCNRRWSSQPVLFKLDHNFNRRLADSNSQKRIPNPVFDNSSSMFNTITNRSVQPSTITITTTGNRLFSSEATNRTSRRPLHNAGFLQ